MGRSKSQINAQVFRDDSFIELPLSAQALYAQCLFECDGYGLFSNPKSLLRLTGAAESDLNELINNGLLMPIKHGGKIHMLIKHWWVNNKLQRNKTGDLNEILPAAVCIIEGSREYVYLSDLNINDYKDIEPPPDDIRTFKPPGILLLRPKEGLQGDYNETTTGLQGGGGSHPTQINSTQSNANQSKADQEQDKGKGSTWVEPCPICDCDAACCDSLNAVIIECPNCGTLSIRDNGELMNVDTGELVATSKAF